MQGEQVELPKVKVLTITAQSINVEYSLEMSLSLIFKRVIEKKKTLSKSEGWHMQDYRSKKTHSLQAL